MAPFGASSSDQILPRIIIWANPCFNAVVGYHVTGDLVERLFSP
ncbi:MAG: hypothetical protein ACI9OO_001888 [Bacteroidia bacterium]